MAEAPVLLEHDVLAAAAGEEACAVESPVAAPEAITPRSASQVVILPVSCTVREVAALKAELVVAAEHASLAVDVRAVERIDTAALQLLCAFVRHCEEKDRPVEWIGASSGFEEAARLLGAAALLHLPESAGAAA